AGSPSPRSGRTPSQAPTSSRWARSPTPRRCSTSASTWRGSARGGTRRRAGSGCPVLLTIDVGNTQTVIGLHDGPDLIQHWRVSTNAERTADEHALLVSELLDLQGFDAEEVVTGIAVSSTVPTLTKALRDMADRWFDVPTVVLEPGVRSGMPILYDNPKEVGADRIANAVGAYDRFGGPTIVVDFGTATTFDVVSARGEYLGGAIVPGVE